MKKITAKQLDDVLIYLYHNGTITIFHDLPEGFPPVGELNMIYHILKYDGYVEEHDMEETQFAFSILNLTPKGAKFIAATSYIEVEEREKLAQTANKRAILTNNASIINVVATIIFGLIVTIIQVRSCNRDTRKEAQEVIQAGKTQ